MATGNTVINSSIISKETLMMFENNLVIGKKVDTSYSDKFGVEDGKIGASYKIRRPVLATVTKNNMAFTNQAIVETQVQLTVTESATVPFTFTDADLALKIDRFSERYVKKVAEIMAATYDKDICDFITNAKSGSSLDGVTVGTVNYANWGIQVSTMVSDTILNAKQLLLDSACPDDGDVYGILSPKANRELSNAQLTLFNAQKKISDIYEKGYVGEFAGIDFSVSQSLATHTNGAVSSITLGATQTGELTSGWAETAAIAISATSGAIKAGDKFSIAGVYAVNPLTKVATSNLQQFTVVADAASGATSLTVAPAPIISGAYQNISATTASGTGTLLGSASTTYRASIIFHKTAIASVSPKLEVPKKSSFDMVEEIENDYLNMRFLRGYDAVGASGNVGFISRLDSFYGVKTVRPDWIVLILEP